MKKYTCKECNKKIDDTTKQCPNCGCKNKLDIDLYLKEQGENNICTKCGAKLNKNDSFCTRCGCKKRNAKNKLKKVKELIMVIYKRNKLIFNFIIALVLFIIIGMIYINNFNRDMIKAEKYYTQKNFYEAELIVNKYPISFNNTTYRKIKATKYLTRYYSLLSEDDDIEDYTKIIRRLLIGYEMCENELTKELQQIEKKAITDLKDLFRYTLVYTYNLSDDDISTINGLDGEEFENKLNEIAKSAKKFNTCEIENIAVLDYYKYDDKMSVMLKNRNGCTWNIEKISQVRVYFTDGSYKNVFLGTDINLKADETYTFHDCYLGYNNKRKTINRVIFID